MSAAADIHALNMAVSPSYVLQTQGLKIDGGVPLDFERYPYLPKIIDTNPPKMSVVKGGQMGFTIAAILKALVLAKMGKIRGHHIRGIGYWFPTHGEASLFAKGRFTPLMSQNEHVWDPRDMDVDSSELKRIGNVSIYLRGSGQKGGSRQKSTSAVKSVPLDINILDERDEMDDARVDAIEMRLTGSPMPQELIFSTPTLPGYGVDLEYQSSDQSSWLWKCPACSDWTCLEDKYPECIAQPNGKDPFYLCGECREPLRKEFGEWVARKPEIVDHVGLWISQLCSPSRTAMDVILANAKAERTGRKREFYNQVLGRAYAEVEDQITEEQLNELLTTEPKPLTEEGPCAMGVDPGKPNWYEVRKRITERDTIQVARGQASSYEELGKIARRYNVESGVMDKGYDPSAVARFCDEHPGWYGALYVNAKVSDPDWNHKEKEVKVGRTWLLDSSHHDLIDRHVSFYQKDDGWPEFVSQMTNLKRTTITNPVTGEQKAQWVVTGGQKNDHLRHAGGYCWLASTKVGLAKSVQRMHSSSRQRNRSGRPRSAMMM